MSTHCFFDHVKVSLDKNFIVGLSVARLSYSVLSLLRFLDSELSSFVYDLVHIVTFFISYIIRNFSMTSASCSKSYYLIIVMQVLGVAAAQSLLSPNPSVKVLKLQGCLEECQQILCLLETFPKLTRLILEAELDHQTIRADEAESFSDL